MSTLSVLLKTTRKIISEEASFGNYEKSTHIMVDSALLQIREINSLEPGGILQMRKVLFKNEESDEFAVTLAEETLNYKAILRDVSREGVKEC